MTRLFQACVIVFLLSGIAAAQQSPGSAEKIGEKIDRGLSQIGAEFSQAWAEVRKSVEKMGVEGRVYGRLHWDKALGGTSLDIDVRDGKVVVLKGRVASAAASQKAEQLARDTVGVASVINELAVANDVSPKP